MPLFVRKYTDLINKNTFFAEQMKLS